MEYILADAEVIGEYFKNIIDLYDGDVTSQELYRDDNFVIFNTCLEQVFECLKTILCWNGFGEQVELLKLALSHFANRSTKLDKDKYRSMNISPPFFFWDTVEIQVTKFKSTNLGTPKPGSCFELPSDWLSQ